MQAARVEAERVEAERVEAERVQAERLQAARAEAERVEAERLQAARAEAERVETERVETERLQVARAEAERVEVERLQVARAEAERVEVERLEAERSRVEAPSAEPDSIARPPDVSAWAPEPAPVAPAPPPVAEPAPPPAPEPASTEDDVASIWGSVDEPAPLRNTVVPLPPDPSTRVSDAPEAESTFGGAPAGPPAPPVEIENPLPFVPWRGALAEPDPFETGEHRVDPAVVNPHDGPPLQYPIPPAGVGEESAPNEGGSGSVPTWAFRAATQAPVGPAAYGDLALDPMSLRSKVTLRAGTSSLVVDDTGLAVRMRMRRSAIAWGDVFGFEPRFDEGGRDGSLVAITRSGPVELAATRRRAGDVRYVHALLDAYRQRAAILGRQ